MEFAEIKFHQKHFVLRGLGLMGVFLRGVPLTAKKGRSPRSLNNRVLEYEIYACTECQKQIGGKRRGQREEKQHEEEIKVDVEPVMVV